MKVRADSNGDGRGDEAVSIELVMALKLYTDHDAMQWALKQCLRGAADYDLSRLFEWRELLDFAVSRCGAKMRRHRLFHGVRDAMELDAVGGFADFDGPLSLTTSLEVARQFATAQGMLLQIGNGYSLRSDRFLDVSTLSGFKNEHEALAMTITTRIYMVSLNRPICGVLDEVCSLFLFIHIMH